MIATLALSIAVARVLGDSAYGQYMSVWALIMILNVVTHMGTETIVMRESARNLSRAPELVADAMTIRLPLSLLAYAGAVIVAFLMEEGRAFLVYAAIAGLSFFVSWHSLIATYFEATLRIGTRTVLVTGCSLLTLAFTMIALFLKMGLAAVLWAAVLAHAVTLTVTYLLVCRHFRPTLGRNLTGMKDILSESWPLAGIAFLIILGARLDLFMLLKMKEAAVVGYYGASLRIAESLAFIPQAFMLSVFPLMSFYYSRERGRFEDIYRRSLKYMSTIILPVALFLSFYSGPILKLSYGENFLEGAPALAILAWFMFFSFIGSVNFAAIIVESRHKALLILSFYSMAVAVALNLLLIPRYGLTGAAVAAVLRQIVLYPTMLLIPSMRKYTIAAVTNSFRPLLAVGCAAACLYGVKPPLGVLLALPVYVFVFWLVRGIRKEDWNLLMKIVRGT